jgi:hypothetical protein
MLGGEMSREEENLAHSEKKKKSPTTHRVKNSPYPAPLVRQPERENQKGKVLFFLDEEKSCNKWIDRYRSRPQVLFAVW